MHGVWLSLKENMNCGAKSIDVFRPERSKGGNRTITEVSPPRELLLERESPTNDTVFWRKHGRERFSELYNGDASRNIVEMIFQASSTARKLEEQPKKIDRVLKVKNLPETLKRFEEHRETVKRRARSQPKRHPRSIVDGNELLMFYTTTMSCCPTRKSAKVSDVCRGPTCRMCRIIQSGFDSNGVDSIRLSTSCGVTNGGDDVIAGRKGDNGKWAVVVCRVIAGRVVNVVDGGCEEGFDSVGNGGLDGKLDHLFLRDPSAVLPCFVIVCA